MRDIIEKKEKDSTNTESGRDDENKKDRNEIQQILLKIGIVSPVTKATAGSAYYEELCRQVCDVILPILEKGVGTISLVDVYCLYNRARGTSLVSPQDLGS